METHEWLMIEIKKEVEVSWFWAKAKVTWKYLCGYTNRRNLYRLQRPAEAGAQGSGQKVSGAIEWERFNQEPHKSPPRGHPEPGPSFLLHHTIPYHPFFPTFLGPERALARPLAPGSASLSRLFLKSVLLFLLLSASLGIQTQDLVLIMRRARSWAFHGRYQYLRALLIRALRLLPFRLFILAFSSPLTIASKGFNSFPDHYFCGKISPRCAEESVSVLLFIHVKQSLLCTQLFFASNHQLKQIKSEILPIRNLKSILALFQLHEFPLE